MNESNSQPEKPKDERRYDPELLKKGLRCDLDQYDFLKQCSEKGEEGIKEWNERRKKHRTEDVFLEGAEFQSLFMDQVHLDEDAANRPGKVYLKDAVFRNAKLNKVRFMKADLRGCDFRHAELNESTLILADIRDADFSYAELRGAKLPFAIVNEKTRFFKGAFDKRTWFWGVALHGMRIADEMRLLLEYNIRRVKWENWFRYQDWYEAYPDKERRIPCKVLLLPFRAFLEVSDYGLRTWRIIVTFFGLAVVFAAIYYICGLIAPPGIIDNLFEVEDAAGKVVAVPQWLVPIRAIHFSVVIMTVGFTNMHANAHSFWAHILVGFQMILGFVLLGALVTRFAVLFTAGGPAGKFADEKTMSQRLKERWNGIKKKG